MVYALLTSGSIHLISHKLQEVFSKFIEKSLYKKLWRVILCPDCCNSPDLVHPSFKGGSTPDAKLYYNYIGVKPLFTTGVTLFERRIMPCGMAETTRSIGL